MRIWVPPDPTTPIRTIGQIRVLVLYDTPGGPTEQASAMARARTLQGAVGVLHKTANTALTVPFHSPPSPN